MLRPSDIKIESDVTSALKSKSGHRDTMKDKSSRPEPISLLKLMQRRSSSQGSREDSYKCGSLNNNEFKEKHIDYRDGSMPDSPDTKPPALSSSLSPISTMPPVISRPLSTSSTVSGVNGAPSPHSSYNGRTPSPPSLGGTTSAQQLPPACGARQLSKLKRFLTTLQQFGSDISPEIGERVRSLVLGLVNSHLSIEEFHGKLQEATNFPLRPFVIPFLKANLPLLQRELLHCARLAKQTPQQYLAHNEHVLFDPSHSPLESQELLSPEINENGKRRSSPDRPKENGIDAHVDVMHPAKRPAMSPVGPNRISPGAPPYNYHMGGPIRLEDISMSREMRERERVERERVERERMERERERPVRGNYHLSDHYDHLERIDDDWKHVENMLHCIVGMVDKCKRALTVLQDRSSRDRDELTSWMRRHSDGMDSDMKKRTSEMMATTLRQTDDRVAEVKRRAEEAVHEVKRQAVAELQKAVTAAEAKASELVAAERGKMDRAISQARKQAQEEALASFNQQEEASESCWNCGRKASETCSGCNVARYCGAFCQHKDWENHHRVCGQNAREHMRGTGGERSSSTDTPAPASTQAAASTETVTPSPTPAAAAPSPTGSTTSNTSRSGSRSSTPAEPAKVEASR